MADRWSLGTASYRGFRDAMGVPLATSVGRNRAFSVAHQVEGLKPYGVFKTMAGEPLEVQQKAYLASLDAHRADIEVRLDELKRRYPAETLVVLCWCDIAKVGLRGCHRRWASEWFLARYEIAAPELTDEWDMAVRKAERERKAEARRIARQGDVPLW